MYVAWKTAAINRPQKIELEFADSSRGSREKGGYLIDVITSSRQRKRRTEVPSSVLCRWALKLSRALVSILLKPASRFLGSRYFPIMLEHVALDVLPHVNDGLTPARLGAEPTHNATKSLRCQKRLATDDLIAGALTSRQHADLFEVVKESWIPALG